MRSGLNVGGHLRHSNRSGQRINGYLTESLRHQWLLLLSILLSAINIMFFLPSPTPAQSLCKLRGQARTDDFVLAASHVVFDAEKRYPPIVIIINEECRTRIAVARLPYASRIDQISFVWLQEQLIVRKRCRNNAVLFAENCHDVSMTEKTEIWRLAQM